MKKNKYIVALIVGALLLFSFRKKSRGSVIVDARQPMKSPDADFLIKAPDGTELLASDGVKVMGKTKGIVYADGFFSRQNPQFYVLRQFGSSNRYYVYAGTVTRL
jgi:hypothetical protein